MPTMVVHGTRSTDPYTLRGLLFCDSCGVPLHPLKLAGGPRAYRGACGCRMRSVDAATVERQVFNAVERRTPALVTGVPAECLAGVYLSVLAEVRAGVTGDELTFVWRI